MVNAFRLAGCPADGAAFCGSWITPCPPTPNPSSPTSSRPPTARASSPTSTASPNSPERERGDGFRDSSTQLNHQCRMVTQAAV